MNVFFVLVVGILLAVDASADKFPDCPNLGDIRFVIPSGDTVSEIAVVHTFDSSITIAKGYTVKSIAARVLPAKTSPLEFLCNVKSAGEESTAENPTCSNVPKDNQGSFVVPQKFRSKFSSIHLVAFPNTVSASAPISQYIVFDYIGDVNFDSSAETTAKASGEKCGVTVVGSPLSRARF